MKHYEYRVMSLHGDWFERGPFDSLRKAEKERAIVRAIHGSDTAVKIQRREITEWEDFD